MKHVKYLRNFMCNYILLLAVYIWCAQIYEGIKKSVIENMFIDFLQIKCFLKPSISHAELRGFRSKHFQYYYCRLLFVSVEPTRNLASCIVQRLVIFETIPPYKKVQLKSIRGMFHCSNPDFTTFAMNFVSPTSEELLIFKSLFKVTDFW